VVTSDELDIKHQVCSLLSALSLSPSNVLLQECDDILASLIMCLSTLTAALWEDSDEIMTKLDLASRVVNIVHEGVLLAHHLLFTEASAVSGSSPGTRLARMLFEPPSLQTQTRSSAVGHMFIVAIGRLSYGFAPQWLQSDQREILENTSELARELLESAIEGPEEDMIWSAYNIGDDATEDEAEQLEAHAMGDD